LPHMSPHKSLNLLLTMYFNGTVHTSNLLLDMCADLLPSPFTLATCAPTCVARCVATCGQCESTISERLNVSKERVSSFRYADNAGRLALLTVMTTYRNSNVVTVRFSVISWRPVRHHGE